jgi:hypothetical protein
MKEKTLQRQRRFEAKGHSMKKGPFDGKSPSIANAHRWQRQRVLRWQRHFDGKRPIDGKRPLMAEALEGKE